MSKYKQLQKELSICRAVLIELNGMDAKLCEVINKDTIEIYDDKHDIELTFNSDLEHSVDCVYDRKNSKYTILLISRSVIKITPLYPRKYITNE